MPLLTLANIRHAYGTQLVLDGVTLSIDPGEKIGMVGRNGCGKTTLLRIILSQLVADSGSMQLMKNARIGYLSQSPAFDPNDTVRDAAERAFTELHELHEQQHQLYDAMATAEGNALDRLLRRQAELEGAIEAAGGYAIDHRIEATLHGLGFADEQFAQPVASLSGGQKGRLGLARLLLEAPDLLLLDEPTNHLDIAGREWLETFLSQEYSGAVLVVSHDRWLLDRVAHRIVEIEQGAVREYPGNYQKFIELRLERKMTEQRVYDKQLDRIRSEETFIARYKAGQRAKQARGRQSKLERYKRDTLVEKPIELDVMKLTLPRIERSGDMVAEAIDLTKQYDNDGPPLFENLTLKVERGDRIGIVGPNGAGKTTLVRCLLGELEPTNGHTRLGSRVNVGYYRQSHEHLDLSLTVWQYLQKVMASPTGETRATEQQARDLAGAFLFSGRDQDKLLADMSGGERSRAVLAGLIGSAHNLLVLDEPTNHLDIPSAERLELALSRKSNWEGTLLLVTHDRALLESTADRLIVLHDDGNVEQFPGTWTAYVERRQKLEQEKLQNTRVQAARQQNAKQQQQQQQQARQQKSPTSNGGLDSLSTHKLEERIETLAGRIKQIDALMLQPDVYTDGSRCKKLQHERDEIREKLEPLEFEWSRRAEDS
ncbi:MAG: ABC-F family ATP-binding cassette domain-containing protein [Phycisphaerales bacterium]